MSGYDALKLENQLCFPLYACAKEITRRYKPFLDRIGLTYTQYITMMVLWEKGELSVKELGESLYLDSGTLTPLLKRLEQKGLLTRKRSERDERSLEVRITKEGTKLRDLALTIPRDMGDCIKLTREEFRTLYSLLYKTLYSIEKSMED